MTKVIWVICLSLLLTNCKNNTGETEEKERIQTEEETSIPDSETTETVEVIKNTETEKQPVKEFNWNDIPITNQDIGDYPYITPPKGMEVSESSSATKSYDFHKLEMFDGTSFFAFEGRVEKMSIKMSLKDNSDQDWNQYLFDKSVSEYLASIGAKLISDQKIPEELMVNFGDTSNERYAHMHDFYIGDVVNDKVRMYVLRTQSQKIGFQVYSNTATGEIGIVEVKDFEQTIEKITASEIKEEIEKNGFVALHINFDTGKSRIKTDSYSIIDEIVKMLKNSPDLKISIEGHTDDVGDDSSNLKLSKNRARAVLMALTDEGIEESRLSSEGFGETKPVSDNTTEDGKAQNRRVELRKQ
ncbi:OmpA family protein [Aquimarina sp. AU119]|uniref:OmpA family protein n=1 Tax=Aquimarina sp. AU119 TaxID=2108528 RepID=UPI000D6956EC|nr:OmpA family protein [Aquimarina sp. AU119]